MVCVDNLFSLGISLLVNSETIARFWSKVRKMKPDECWPWQASKRNKGYGAFVWADENGKVVQGRAHRFSFEIHQHKPEKCVLHTCDNPPCVNPRHLFEGTRKDNNDDMQRKGRKVPGGTHLKANGLIGKYERGTEHHNAKLSPLKIRQIRELKTRLSYSQLSSRFGIAIGHLHRIVTRKVWKHVK